MLTAVETPYSLGRGEHERTVLGDSDDLAFGHATAGLQQGDSSALPGMALQPLPPKRREAFAGKPREDPGNGLERLDEDGRPPRPRLAVARACRSRSSHPLARLRPWP